jgi:virginiamycin B lyase
MRLKRTKNAVVAAIVSAALTACNSSSGSLAPSGAAMYQPVPRNQAQTAGVSREGVKFTVYTMPQAGVNPFDIALGNNGYLYANQPGPGNPVYLWQISPSGHIAPIKPGLGFEVYPGLTRGNSGGVLGALPRNGGEVLYSYFGGKLSEKALPLPAINAVYYLKQAKDGSIWFSDPGDFRAGHVVGGKGFLYNSPTQYCSPYGITVGPDGNAWTAEQCPTTNGRIGRITPGGAWKEFKLSQSNAQPEGITVGADKNLWFTIPSTNTIGKITTSGKITEYSLAKAGVGQPTLIAAGNDGALWFSVNAPPKIGRITTSGSAAEYSLPPCQCSDEPFGITAGVGRTIWVTTVLGNHIEKLSY